MRNSISKAYGGLALGLALAFGGPAHGTITIIADYKLGDADPGAVAGNPGNATTLDSSGNGFNLTTKFGSPTYSSDVHPASVTGLSMSFDGAGSYYLGPTVSDATQNFGIDALVKPSDVSGVRAIAVNGSGCCTGFGLFLQDGSYYWLYGGVNADLIAPAVVGEWAHIAVVNEDGFTSIYFNGALMPVGFVGGPTPASTDPVCCDPVLGMTVGSDGSNHFNGLIDRARVFTFASGEFDVDDLRIPEPATAALFGVGIAALGWARRRRA